LTEAPRYVVVSAWAVPITVSGQFALLAVVSVALVLYGALRDTRTQALRWPAGLAAVYATPLAIWLLRLTAAGACPRTSTPCSSR
jgi:hypothetical protein